MPEGRPARGIRHVLACRACIEEATRFAGYARLQQARQRQDKKIARSIEAVGERLGAPRARSEVVGRSREVGDREALPAALP